MFSPCLTLISSPPIFFLFFFNDPPTPYIYTLSLHDALPISLQIDRPVGLRVRHVTRITPGSGRRSRKSSARRSEEHTSELQSPYDLVCRLLLEKKKKKKKYKKHITIQK